MKEATIVSQTKGKEFRPKDAILVFSSFTLVCFVAIIALIVNDVLTIKHFLSFSNPLGLVMYTTIASIGLVLFGVILNYTIPSKYIDDVNKEMVQNSFSVTVSLLFTGALFEELFFRGIIQNLLFTYTNSMWAAILIANVLFVCFHIRYFKKPIMLLNITLPGIVFGCIYFETSNLLVPFVAHFLANLGMSLLYKYKVIRLKH